MLDDKITRCLGLITQYNPLAIAPGGMAKADNVVIRRENIIEDRRGYSSYATRADNITQLLTYQSKVLAHHGTTISYDNGSGTFSAYSGSYSAISGQKIRGVEAFSNLYMTTSLGVKVFTDVAGTAARLSGAPRSLDPSYSLTGASGFLANSFQCAYRSVIQRTDANKNVVTGYPSQRLWVINAAGGSRNVILTNYLPSEAAAGDVIQFYRADQVSGTSDDTSGDEMGLVYQYELLAADITAGYVQFTDSVTDSLIGATLYTSPSQEGISQANDRPPLAKDICLHRNNFMLYANTKTKQRLFVTLVGAGSLSAKTITLGGITYNFGASEIISGGGSPQALVSATGVAAVDIDLTARSLVRVINRYATNTTVYAYYLSGAGDLPGQLMIEEKGVGAAAFTLQASDTAIAGMFFPAPPVSPTTTTKSTSTNQEQKNAIFISKNQQPEHVPATAYVFAGAANAEVLRIVALRDSSIVIKEDGVYRVNGESVSAISVTPIDNTLVCLALESVCVLDNQVYMLSNRGVVAISENGVQVMSRDIEPNLTKLFTVSLLKDYTTAVGYESEASYIISTITNTDETVANQTFIYNVFTKTWVRWTFGFKAAIVPGKTLDKMFFAKPSDVTIYRERKDFSDTDYCDPESTITLTSVSGTTVEFTSSVTPQIGYVIKQGTTEIPISAITVITGGWRATVSSTPPASWAAGSATLFPNVGFDVDFHSWNAGKPNLTKQIAYGAVFADDTEGANSVTALILKFKSNFDAETAEVTVSPDTSGWGGSWGSMPWGGGVEPGYMRTVPRNKQYASRLTFGVKHQNARERLSIAGYGFIFNMVSERIGR